MSETIVKDRGGACQRVNPATGEACIHLLGHTMGAEDGRVHEDIHGNHWLDSFDSPSYAERVSTRMAASKPLDEQVGGSHYKGLAIQPATYSIANGLGWAEGDVVKYVTRWKAKNGVEDLKKAAHLLAILIDAVERGVEAER